MPRKTPMTFDEHVETGMALKRLREELTSIRGKLIATHPAAKYENRLRTIERIIDRIRSDLDNEVCGMYPLSVSEVKGRRLTQIYYGGPCES